MRRFCIAVLFLAGLGSFASAETCQTSSDMDDATRTALISAAHRYFDMAAKGDSATLRQNAIPSVAADFSGIEETVKRAPATLAGSPPADRSAFVLQADGNAPIARAEFYCGVFGKNGQTSNSAVFVLNNLPPAKYAVVLLDAKTGKPPSTLSLVLQQMGTDWKLGGLYLTSAQAAGHDSEWYAARAREYKTKGQMHNAWLYLLEARNLASPLAFMSTAVTDKLYDESQTLQVADIPSEGKTVDLAAGTVTYKLTSISVAAVGDDLDVVVKYQASDVSNTGAAYQNNLAVIKALVAKYPELKEAFAGVVARAVAPSGQDYGTLLAMKDVK